MAAAVGEAGGRIEPQARHIEAGRAIWDGRPKPASSARSERRRMMIQAVVGIAIGSAFLLRHHPAVGFVALSIASVSLAISIVAPDGWVHAVHRGLAALASGIGTAVSAIVLTFVYVCFFVPVGLLQRGSAKARFQRALNRSAPTYWTKHKAPTSPERQF